MFNLVKDRVKFFLKKNKLKEPFNVNVNVQEIIENIKKDGYAVVPNFYSEEECKILREEVDNLIEKRKENNNLWTDTVGADNRCFAAEDDSELISKYNKNEFLNSVADNYFNGKMSCSNTLAARIQYVEGNVGSGEGWHRDGNHFQFKAITYLSDVEIKDGPFQIIKGSHQFMNVIKDTITMNTDSLNTRFTDDQVKKVIKKNNEKYTLLTAKAGTLVFADVSTIHTGMPLSENGQRYTLFNYYYPSYDNIEKRKETFRNAAKSKAYI